MVLVGHSQRLAEPLTSRQRRALTGTGIVLVALLIGVGAWLATHKSGDPVSRNGCINMIVAGPTGGILFHECGSDARAWCKTAFSRDDFTAKQDQHQCRLAGIKPPQD